jgi:hypothetical protein
MADDWAGTKAWELVNEFVAGHTGDNEIIGLGNLVDWFASALREERERCAGIAERSYRYPGEENVYEIAKAIRETGE